MPIVIRSECLAVTLLPEVGGKVSQIEDTCSKTSLLIGAHSAYVQIPHGHQWSDYDTSGMDDCFPNVAPDAYPYCPWVGRQLPQLGEWVYGGWNVTSASRKEVTIEREGSLLPYHACKTLRFTDPRTLLITYLVDNLSDFPLRYLWSAHPLLALNDKFHVKLPEGEKYFRTFPFDGTRYCWPIYDSTDLSLEWIGSGRTLKVFVEGLAEGWCELQSSEYRVRFSFDLISHPCVGLWFNNYGFPRAGQYPAFRCVALEPCTSPTDSLADLGSSSYPVIGARDKGSWWVAVSVFT